MHRPASSEGSASECVENQPEVEVLAHRLQTHLIRLSKQIGARPGGSPANVEAAQYIRRVFEVSGLDVDMQIIPCRAWTAFDTRLELGGIALSAAANGYSPRCNVQAAAISAGTITELESLDLTNRIVVLYGDLTRTPLSPKDWFLTSERDRRIIRILEGKAPLAIVAIQQNCGELERVIEDPDFRIPSMTVPTRTGLAILGCTDPVIHVRIDSVSYGGQTWNIVGRRNGSSGQRLLLCAHYDTKFDTPGALDNASGVAVLLSLAQRRVSDESAVGIEYIAFGNEESLPEGTQVYLEQVDAAPERIVAVLNFDGVGHALDINTVSAMGHAEGLKEIVTSLAPEFPSIVEGEPWLESNHGLFAWRGVPCLAFTSPSTRKLAHLRGDTADWVSLERLGDVTRFAGKVIDRLRSRDAG